MGTLGHQGIFVIAIYFFLLIIAHYRLPSVQNNIKAEHKAKQNELKKRLGQLKKWEGEMIRHGFIDEMTFTQAINFLVEQNVDFPSEFKFRSVLVDEYQDLSTFDIKFLERLVTVKRNGLFLIKLLNGTFNLSFSSFSFFLRY